MSEPSVDWAKRAEDIKAGRPAPELVEVTIESLKAERDEWKKLVYGLRAERDEARVEGHRLNGIVMEILAERDDLQAKLKEWKPYVDEYGALCNRYVVEQGKTAELQAKLDAQAPVIKAIEKARLSTLTEDHAFWLSDEDAILNAAFDLKAKKGRKP